MTKYKVRPGVVLTQVCGEHILVAAKAARAFCPYISRIHDSSALLWGLLAQGADLDEMVQTAVSEYPEEDPGTIRTAILVFLQQMLDCGYLLKEGDKNEEE